MKPFRLLAGPLALFAVSCATPDRRSPDSIACDPSRAPAQAQTVRCDAVFGFVDKTEEFQSRFREIGPYFAFTTANERGIGALQMIRKEYVLRAKTKGTHPADEFGFEAYRRLADARAFLASISEGRFRLTPELIEKTHSIVSGREAKIGESPSEFLADASSLIEPLSEAQYRNLKANRWLIGFREAAWPISRKDARRGVIRYADRSTALAKVRELISWVDKNHGVLDPVEIAAELEAGLVAIRPFGEGTAETARLLVNRYLFENELPPALFTREIPPVFLSPKERAREMRDGIEEFFAVAAVEGWGLPVRGVHDAMVGVGSMSLVPKTSDRWRALFRERVPWMSECLTFMSRRLSLGGRDYVLLEDGFFYSAQGIPHVVHDGKLYPIADRTYALYGEGGESRPGRLGRRRLNPSHREVVSAHLKLLRAAEEGRADLSRIEVQDYSAIAEANGRGELFLYPWQKALFERAIETGDRLSPFDVLAGGRLESTAFDEALRSRSPVSASVVLAQYQKIDIKFREYDLFARRSGDPAAVRRIRESRRKLFDSARVLLDEVDAARRKAIRDPADVAVLESHPRWVIFRHYLEHTPLKYRTFEEAMRNEIPGRVALLRSDIDSVSRLGFRSNKGYVDLAKSLPGYGLFREWVKDRRDAAATGRKPDDALTKLVRKALPGFDDMVQRFDQVLSAHPLDTRAAETAFDRAFVDQSLHAGNQPLKDALSFSTSPDLYRAIVHFQWQHDGPSVYRVEPLPFTTFTQPSKLYVASAEIGSEVSVNVASRFSSEYEMLVLRKLPANAILEEIPLPAPGAELKFSQTVEDFFDRGFNLTPPPIPARAKPAR